MVEELRCGLGRKVADRLQSLVSKCLTHSVRDVLSTDAKDVQKLLGFPASRNTTHCQPGHNNARLLADS